MRLVKYWHVRLFQSSHISGVSGGSGFSGGAITNLLAEGYTLIEPNKFQKHSEFISLFTSPDPNNREFIQVRVDNIHSMLATPVYEEDNPVQKADCDCRVSHVDDDETKYPSDVSMAVYIAQAIFDGYRSQEIGVKLDFISSLSAEGMRLEYLRCWKWRRMREDNDEDIEKVKYGIAEPLPEAATKAGDHIMIKSCRHYGIIGAQPSFKVIEDGDSDIIVSSSDENIVTATYADGELHLSCVGLGRADVILTKGDSHSSIEVIVEER